MSDGGDDGQRHRAGTGVVLLSGRGEGCRRGGWICFWMCAGRRGGVCCSDDWGGGGRGGRGLRGRSGGRGRSGRGGRLGSWETCFLELGSGDLV